MVYVFELEAVVGPTGRADQENRPPRIPEEQAVLPNVPTRLNELRRLGHALVMVANMPEVASGAITRQQAANVVMRASMSVILGGVEMWQVADDETPPLPSPAMILHAAARLGTPVQYVTVVGATEASWRAAMAAGATWVPADVFFGQTLPRPSFRQPPLAGHIPAGSVLRLLDGEPEHFNVGAVITADAVVVMPDAGKVDL